MNTNFHILNAKSFICLAAAAACAIISGPVQANGHEVTVKISVSTAGLDLDLSQPAGAQKFYWRLEHAARVACTHGYRVGLEPPTNFTGCYEKALGEAVHSVHRAEVSTVYLATHTPRDAARYGIEVPVRMAAE
jgi:UrcA family protein